MLEDGLKKWVGSRLTFRLTSKQREKSQFVVFPLSWTQLFCFLVVVVGFCGKLDSSFLAKCGINMRPFPGRGMQQGDQIGRIFAYWMVAYAG
jgi:hypothetical protein